MKKSLIILVTGGAGFIGSNFVRYLLASQLQAQVICLDALTYAGNKKNLETVLKNPRFTFIKGNITDEKLR